MNQILSDRERSRIEKHVADTEKQTGAQIVIATVRRSDSYVEIPWKAFAIGASLGGVLVLFLVLFVLGWLTEATILFSIAMVLATGALFVLLAIALPGFARLFLSASRREMETMQYAESLFLSNELFSTEGRRGILLLVSQFERQVVILPDKGVRDLLGMEILQDIISNMSMHLRRNDMAEAMESGLGGIRSALGDQESGGEWKNELSNEIIEEEGI